jgi:hypothetical protein
MGKSFDSSWVVPSFKKALLVRLVVEGSIVVIVCLITSFLLNMLMLLTSAVNLIVCSSAAYDVMQILVILILPLATFLWWSDTASQVSTWTLLVVRLVTPYFTIMVEDWVNHGCCVQYHL